ncbi:MAG: ABC transporter permease [Candidatus Thorarchaeota archaeon]
MESESQTPQVQDNNGADAITFRILTIIQIIFIMGSLMLGGIIFLGNFAYMIQGLMGIIIVPNEMLSMWSLQGFLILILSLLFMRTNQGVMEKLPDSFGTSIYLYIFLTVIFATMGLLGLVFIIAIVLQLVLFFIPSVRLLWFEEFVEDTKPRIKETRFTLHLVKKSPLVVVGILIIVFMVGIAFSAPWITTYAGTDMVFADKQLPPGSNSTDIKLNFEYLFEEPELNPDVMPSFYYNHFTITEDYLKTVEDPRLFIGVSDMNTGIDVVSVNVTFRIYNLNVTEYEGMTVSERLSYIYSDVTVITNSSSNSDNLLEYIYLPDEVADYTWELQFTAPQKTNEWSANTRVVISFYSIYPVHIWGTDNYGGDIYSRIIWAAQEDLKISLSVVVVAVTIGAVIGAISGYYGGKFDELVMRVTDIFFAFPGLVLAMAIVMALGTRSLETISIALMITWWPTYARLVRAQVLTEREKLYIEAARSSGASDTRILVSHILPNTIQPVIVQATMDIGSVLLVAAGLAFIGFGPPVGTAEWGMMIANGQDFILSSPWMTMYPGLAILVTALAFNLVGDGIRDIMDPKLRRR